MRSFDVEWTVSHLQLDEHPEGGFYRRTYASELTMDGTPPGRAIGSAILYLLPRGQVSRLHRIDADEMWHHYDGDQLTVVEIKENGMVKQTVLGKNLAVGETPQYVVKSGTWFGAFIPEGSRGALVGCTVHPEFLFDTFQLANRDQILPLIAPSDHPVVEKLL